MRKLITFGVLLGALAVGMFVASTASEAQGRENPGTPVDVAFCKTERFDLNGDGYLSKSDMRYWIDQVRVRGCQLGSPATGNCTTLDINNDGYIDQADVMTMYDHFLTCYEVLTPNSVFPGRR